MGERIYRKYAVRRLNDPEGKHADCAFFVLDPEHDLHARAALRAYAESCADEKPDLAVDLRVMAGLARVAADHPGAPAPMRRSDLKPVCPTCGTERTWLQWVAMSPSDTDSWACVNRHTWAEATDA